MNIGNNTHLAKTGIMNKNNPKLMNLGGQDLETSQNHSVFDMTQQVVQMGQNKNEFNQSQLLANLDATNP